MLYISKSKRITSLEKQVSELQKQIETLTSRLDQANEMLLRSGPNLARSIERDWEEINPPPPTPKQPKQRYKTLPLFLRADACFNTLIQALGSSLHPVQTKFSSTPSELPMK